MIKVSKAALAASSGFISRVAICDTSAAAGPFPRRLSAPRGPRTQ